MKNIKEVLHTIETNTHVYFFGYESPFSNFHYTKFEYKGHIVNSSEQAFMLEKAYMFDPTMIDIIAKTTNPAQVKKLGRKVQNFDAKKWSDVSFDVMVNILIRKFENENLRQLLLDTGDKIIVEASPYDSLWGAGISINDITLLKNEWTGKNLLGKALMTVRSYYKNNK